MYKYRRVLLGVGLTVGGFVLIGLGLSSATMIAIGAIVVYIGWAVTLVATDDDLS